MGVILAGIGSAVPEGEISQPAALDLLLRLVELDSDGQRLAAAVYGRSGIDRRGSVLCRPDGTQDLYQPDANPPTTAERMRLYLQYAPPLAERAARGALEAAGLAPSSITHLVTASCTGFAAPGVDIELLERLGLRRDVQRAHIGFMGCHAAINALGVAETVVRSGRDHDAGDPPCVLVVCVELSSLHMQFASEPEQVVVGALFADGAAACVLTGDGVARSEGTGAHPRMRAELLAKGSVVLPDSKPAMGWTVGDAGFRMTLAESIPDLIRAHLRPWLVEWLSRVLPDSPPLAALAWGIHPGGPKVLEATRDALGLPDSALRFSRASLRRHGNMSSASILFILQSMVEAEVAGPAVLLAFGPGISVEAALVRLDGGSRGE